MPFLAGKLGKSLTAKDGEGGGGSGQSPSPAPLRSESGSGVQLLQEDLDVALTFSGGGTGGAGSPFNEPSSGIQALVAAHDGSMWVAYRKGHLERYTFAGRLLWGRELKSGVNVQALCAVGTRIWVGGADGSLTVLDAEGNTLKSFRAHATGLINIVQVRC